MGSGLLKQAVHGLSHSAGKETYWGGGHVWGILGECLLGDVSGSWMQSVCVAVMICAILVNTHAHKGFTAHPHCSQCRLL